MWASGLTTILLWFELLSLVIAQTTSQTPAALNSAQSKAVQDIATRNKVPGLAALVVASNGTISSGASGVRKYGDPTVMTSRDMFHLGSNTKAMTATLLGKIMQTGNSTLSWNTTLDEALPNITSIHSGFHGTTLRMLASHRSGISTDVPTRDLRSFGNLYNSSLPPTEGRRRVADTFLLQAPDFTPDTGFNYSNVNYILLGLIIDTLGTPYEDRIVRDLWTPLGMTNCGFGPTPESSATSIENPWAHRSTPEGPVPISSNSTLEPADNPITYNSAGRAHCTPASYAAFLNLHLQALKGQNTTYLTSASFKELHQPYPIKQGEKAANIFTAGGWIHAGSDSPYGLNSLVHAGSNTVNYALAVISPSLSVAVAGLTNIGGDGGEKAVVDIVTDFLKGFLEGNSGSGKNSGAGINRVEFTGTLMGLYMAALLVVILGVF